MCIFFAFCFRPFNNARSLMRSTPDTSPSSLLLTSRTPSFVCPFDLQTALPVSVVVFRAGVTQPEVDAFIALRGVTLCVQRILPS